MDVTQTLVLALVQGLTEFLPVSSSAHLVLVPVLTGWPDQGLAFDVALHIGSLVAVLVYFREDLARMARDWVGSLMGRGLTTDARLAWAVGLGTIPVGLAGLFLEPLVSQFMRSPVILAIGMIVFGLLLGWADRRHGARTEGDMTWRDVAWIACAQVLALIPGTSRSGITLTAGLMCGLSRAAAARFSFLLSIPVIVIAGGLETVELVKSETTVNWTLLALGTVVSGIAAYACIRTFLAWVPRIGMMPFVVYRVLLGLALLWMFAPLA